MGSDETRIGRLEPVGAVGNPPGGHATRDCCGDGPPKGQSDVGNEAEGCEGQPKYFALHESSLEEWGRIGASGKDSVRSRAANRNEKAGTVPGLVRIDQFRFA